ncbi:Uncharacterised protein [uncultured archaeon]|nr:Uncharacterised protein [uncultured archaeon]
MHKYAFYGIVFFGLAFILFSISLLSNTQTTSPTSNTVSTDYIQKSANETSKCYKFDVYVDRLCGIAYSRDELNSLLLSVFNGRSACKTSGVLTVYCYSTDSNQKEILYTNEIVDVPLP